MPTKFAKISQQNATALEQTNIDYQNKKLRAKKEALTKDKMSRSMQFEKIKDSKVDCFVIAKGTSSVEIYKLINKLEKMKEACKKSDDNTNNKNEKLFLEVLSENAQYALVQLKTSSHLDKDIVIPILPKENFFLCKLKPETKFEKMLINIQESRFSKKIKGALVELCQKLKKDCLNSQSDTEEEFTNKMDKDVSNALEKMGKGKNSKDLVAVTEFSKSLKDGFVDMKKVVEAELYEEARSGLQL